LFKALSSPRTAPANNSYGSAAGAGFGGPLHVVIFLNGMGGTPHDQRLLRAALKLHHPHLFLYACTTNQGKATEGDLIDAGIRVAKEIHSLLTERLETEVGPGVLGRISFVAFSLGGIVARMALRHPLLVPFRPAFHAFVSVASPHLGMLYASAAQSAGLYLFRAWRKSPSLAQLSFTDEPTNGPRGLRDCLLYLLACGWDAAPPPYSRAPGTGAGAASTVESAVSGARRASDVDSASSFTGTKTPVANGTGPRRHADRVSSSAAAEASATATIAIGTPVAVLPEPRTVTALRDAGFDCEPNGAIMRSFRHVVLYASPQDLYAPFAACSVEWCEPALSDTRHGAAYGEMVRGFYDGGPAQTSASGIPLDAVTRVAVTFRRLPSALSGRISVDSVIGREAHLAFLESDEFAAALALHLPHLWDVEAPIPR
jgi:hypothetical protein